MNCTIAAWNIRGMTDTSKQDKVKLLISENKLNMCAIIETRLIKKAVNACYDNIFGSWNWVSNSVDSNRGCRIAVGCDNNIVDAKFSSIDQVMHFEDRVIQDKRIFFFFYLW